MFMKQTTRLSLEKNDRFAVLTTDAKENASVFDTTGYYTLYHVFERTEKSALIFQSKLMDILVDVKVEGTRKLDSDYSRRPYDLSWFRATKCGDGSILLRRGNQETRLEHGIQLTPHNLECTQSPRSSFSSDCSSPRHKVPAREPPPQEENHKKGKLSLFSSHFTPPKERLEDRFEKEDPLEQELDLDSKIRMAELHMHYYGLQDDEDFWFEPLTHTSPSPSCL